MRGQVPPVRAGIRVLRSRQASTTSVISAGRSGRRSASSGRSLSIARKARVGVGRRRGSPRSRLQEGQGERVDVPGRGHRVAFRRFRGHVGERPEDVPGIGQVIAVGQPGDP